MSGWISGFLWTAGIFLVLSSGWMIFTFYQEKAYNALSRTILVFSSPGLLLFAISQLNLPVVNTVLAVMVFILIILFLIPPRIRVPELTTVPAERIDERDIMFSRRLLKKGMPEFTGYYQRHPEKKEADDHFREKPGLLSPEAKMFDPFTFFAADALFDTVETLSHDVQGDAEKNKIHTDPRGISLLLKSWIMKMGAKSAGITIMQPWHFYHTGGRKYNYGEKITPEHRYGLAFTVEMDEEMIATGPAGPAVMESATQYLEAGKIAIVLARYIRKLGFAARAHIDGHYLVVCPLVARDAGLGEIGRMGLLMTPRLGPRVRIGVVTTDMPLVADHYRRDQILLDFCFRCRKCADNCPVKAIPYAAPEIVNEDVRWQINQEACYTYWTVTGTDCGRCVAVCPYSHRDNLFHRLVRLGIRKSWLVNRLALPLDDFFYGRNPSHKTIPRWLKPEAE